MAEERKFQLTLTNEKLIEKIDNYAAYGFTSRREFVCAAVIAYDNPLMAEARMHLLAEKFAEENLQILEKREEAKRRVELANEFL